MYSLVKNEYIIFKPVENHHKKGIKVERSKMEEMNQNRAIIPILMKRHKETPCVAILNKQKCLFFLNKIREQEGRRGPAWGFGTSGRGWK
jgi:hypothetical protein